MRHYAQKAAAAGFLVFLGLWIVGTLRGLSLPYPPPPPILSSLDREYVSSPSDNFANNLKQIGLVETPLPLVLDNPDVDKIRIHEKRALLATNSSEFNDDVARVRTLIKAHEAEIFTEKNTGIEPGRKLILEIGVSPEQFDSLVEGLRKIAHLSSADVEQKDRTTQFRKLHAQRQALKKHLESITRLRDGKHPSLDEALKLEQKIQDIEKELQTLSLQAGDLLGKKSYYHVHMSLVEFQPGDRRDHTYTTPQRIFQAFQWAVVWWFAVALAAAIVAATGVSVWTLWRKSLAP